MKTYSALVIGFALCTTVAARSQDFAERPDKEVSHFRETVVRVPDLRKAEVNYLANLSSEVPGVVESSLGHVTLMRIAFPTRDMGSIRTKLYDLASSGATKSIRQKAFIAMQVFANPLAYQGAIAGRQASGDGLLEALAEEMQTVEHRDIF